MCNIELSPTVWVCHSDIPVLISRGTYCSMAAACFCMTYTSWPFIVLACTVSQSLTYTQKYTQMWLAISPVLFLYCSTATKAVLLVVHNDCSVWDLNIPESLGHLALLRNWALALPRNCLQHFGPSHFIMGMYPDMTQSKRPICPNTTSIQDWLPDSYLEQVFYLLKRMPTCSFSFGMWEFHTRICMQGSFLMVTLPNHL